MCSDDCLGVTMPCNYMRIAPLGLQYQSKFIQTNQTDLESCLCLYIAEVQQILNVCAWFDEVIHLMNTVLPSLTPNKDILQNLDSAKLIFSLGQSPGSVAGLRQV